MLENNLVPSHNGKGQLWTFCCIQWQGETDFDLQGDILVWYARPQLFFKCTLYAKGPGFSASHKEVSLVYISTFEPINLNPDSIMQLAGVPML